MATSDDGSPSIHVNFQQSDLNNSLQPSQFPSRGSAEAVDGLDADLSAASNNTNTTATPPPLPTIALNPSNFQELPPLPPALQRPRDINFSSIQGENENMGAAANNDSAPTGTASSKEKSLRDSIGLLKKEMVCLRNADLALLHQLNELHQQIVSYKTAMNERLERQSETNSEYSTSLTEDFDEEFAAEVEAVDEDDENENLGQATHQDSPRATERLRILAMNGDGPVRGNSSARRLSGADGSQGSSTESHHHLSPHRASMHHLRQHLPPPPPRPSGERPSSLNSNAVNNWLDLNFKPDAYNC